MKPVRYKTVLGLAIGERSLLAAEVVAGEKPIVRRVAELEYPPGVVPSDAVQFGAFLTAFRKEHGFAARATVLGLPAKWIVVKPKDVPPVDQATLIELLRTGAEAEFSSDLKDMTYDFVDATESAVGKSVLLVATPNKYVQAVETACETAKLLPAAITSSALVLGEATGKSAGAGAMVLAVSPGAAELTARQNGSPSAVRYLRGPEQPAPFISAVRRAMSTMPASSGRSEIVLWDQTGIDAGSLGKQLGIAVRGGELASLGVDVAVPGLNGTAGRFAPAVALALSCLGEARPAVDFLHSRLAPPPVKRIPRWAYSAGALAVLILALALYGYVSLSQQQTALEHDRATAEGMKASVETAKAYVARVTFAKAWQERDPRYVTCLRGLTVAMADDDQTYATNVVLRESAKIGSAAVVTTTGDKPPPTGELFGQITGKASDPNGWSKLQSRLHSTAGFTDVKLLSTSNADRSHEVSFSITFNFKQPAPNGLAAKAGR